MEIYMYFQIIFGAEIWVILTGPTIHDAKQRHRPALVHQDASAAETPLVDISNISPVLAHRTRFDFMKHC
jgi:hypothetical protein